MNDTESAIKRIISDKAPKEYNVSVLFYGKVNICPLFYMLLLEDSKWEFYNK